MCQAAKPALSLGLISEDQGVPGSLFSLSHGSIYTFLVIFLYWSLDKHAGHDIILGWQSKLEC
jgi:hypothetical protein